MENIDYNSTQNVRRFGYFVFATTFMFVMLVAWQPMKLGEHYVQVGFYLLAGFIVITILSCGGIGLSIPFSFTSPDYKSGSCRA